MCHRGSHLRAIISRGYFHRLLVSVRDVGAVVYTLTYILQVRLLFTIATNAAAPSDRHFRDDKPLDVVIVTRKISREPGLRVRRRRR